MEDHAIIDLYYSRAESAIAETSSKYGNYCGFIARNILPTQEDVEECLNDTWMQAWNTIPPEKPENFRVYLGCLVRHISINLYHKIHAKKRCQALDVMLSELDECIPTNETTESEADQRHLTSVINKWLGTLPVKDRRLFLQRYWYGYDLKSMAGDYGCSANSLASKMKRLRKGLRQMLEKEGYTL